MNERGSPGEPFSMVAYQETDRDTCLTVAGGSAFATCDLDEARHYMAGVFRPHSLRLASRTGSLAMRHESLKAGGISVHWLRYGSQVVMTAPEMDRFYLFQINLRGACEIAHGREAVVVPDAHGYVVDPSRPLSKSWEERCEQLIVRVERDAFERFSAREIGVDVRGR